MRSTASRQKSSLRRRVTSSQSRLQYVSFVRTLHASHASKPKIARPRALECTIFYGHVGHVGHVGRVWIKTMTMVTMMTLCELDIARSACGSYISEIGNCPASSTSTRSISSY